jgi:hypothetical protein
MGRTLAAPRPGAPGTDVSWFASHPVRKGGAPPIVGPRKYGIDKGIAGGQGDCQTHAKGSQAVVSLEMDRGGHLLGDERVRVVKDLAAGAVLVSAAGAALIGAFTFLPYVAHSH